MPKLSALSESIIRHIMVFGPPKSGKTELCGKLAKYKKLIWFDLEMGFSTLFKLPPELQDNIELIAIPDNRGNPMAIETMLKVIKGTKVSICEAHGKVSCPFCAKSNAASPGSAPSTEIELNALDDDACVVVDSLTQLTNSAIANITKTQPVDYKLNYDDWAHLGKLMDTFLSYVQSARFNVICISHELGVKMNDGSEKLVPTAGTTNFSRNSAKYFDDVVYTRVANGKHTFNSATTAVNSVLTGSRAGVDLAKEAKEGEVNLISLWKQESK